MDRRRSQPHLLSSNSGMATFLSLEIAFSADVATAASWGDLCASESLLLARVESLRLSLGSGRYSSSSESSTLIGAVFLPRILTYQFLKLTAEGDGEGVAGRQVIDWIDTTATSSSQIQVAELSGFSARLMTTIHPSLCKEQVRAIFVSQNEHHSPADLILFDLTHASQQHVRDLLEATNCRVIQDNSQGQLLLKVLLVSDVFFRRHDSGTLHIPRLQDAPPIFDIPTCPLCIHRIDPVRIGLLKPRNAHLCSKFCPPPSSLRHGSFLDDDACLKQQLLLPWPAPSRCACCQNIASYWNHASTGRDIDAASKRTKELTDMFCYKCPMQETLWVCLTCGFVGCGRYSNKHAADHFYETSHPFSLELATLRIWDYVESEYAHRTDLLECPSSPPLLHPFRNFASPTWSSSMASRDSGNDLASAALASAAHYESAPLLSPLEEKTPKKASMIGEEYEALLQSALEEQAQHYEGEIARLRAALTAQRVDASQMTEGERRETEDLQKDISLLRTKIEAAAREVLDAQAQEAGHRAMSQKLLREQQVTQSLIAKVKDESLREQVDGRRQIDELEQQIADLAANQRMRHQFSQDDELSNAQLFGTQTIPTDKKKVQKKLGKKSSRLFRR